MKRTRDRGVALLLALLVLVILVVVIMQMAAGSLHNRTVADNHLADLQNAYGARAGYARALLFLQASTEEKADVSSLLDRWAQPIEFELGRAQVRVTILDSERFLNVNQVVNDKGEQVPAACDQLRRLVKTLRFTPDIADRIIDYIDADSKGEFEAKAKNERLYTLEELLRIEGLTPEIVYGGMINGEKRKGLREFLTIWPRTTGDQGATPATGTPDPATGAPAPSTGSTFAPNSATGSTTGMININTASSEVLQSLSDQMTPVMAEAIVAYRTQSGPDGKPQVFSQVDELKRVQGMGDALYNDLNGKVTVKSQTFEIRCRGTVGKVEKTWAYVVQRKASASPSTPAGTPPPDPAAATPATSAPTPPALTLIGSQMLTDFASIKPPETQN